MSFSKQLQKTFEKEYSAEKSQDYNYKKIFQEKMQAFRKDKDAITKLEHPSNIARARNLGFKAKQGVIVVRVRVRKGSGGHKRPVAGRRAKRMGVNKLTRKIGIQTIAEQRASKKYANCEALNSYWVGEDGQNSYFEVILVDKSHPSVLADKDLNWIAEKQHDNRALRGLTSSAKKGRGLSKKGIGAERVRPSSRAKGRKAK